MNDLLGSEFSSGCESGWTLYLEQSYLSQRRSLHEQHQYSGNNGKDHEEEEEDLSMVSDASSGPPHFHEEDKYGINNQNNGPNIDAKSAAKNGGKRDKTKEYRRRKVQEQLCLLDDTASSPIFNFSNNNLALGDNQAPMENVLDFSQGHSSTHFQIDF
ncbi:hypothetical protein LguiB_021998 [Lonicera macranthoides]